MIRQHKRDRCVVDQVVKAKYTASMMAAGIAV